MIDASAAKQLAAYRLGISECQVPSQQNLTPEEREAVENGCIEQPEKGR